MLFALKRTRDALLFRFLGAMAVCECSETCVGGVGNVFLLVMKGVGDCCIVVIWCCSVLLSSVRGTAGIQEM